MNQAVIGSFIALAACFLVPGRALAITEYCPAAVSSLTPIGVKTGPATMYSFFLNAEGKRSVNATIDIDTNAGWFSMTVPTVDLTLHTYNESFGAVDFQRANFESDLLYVRFAQPVSVVAAFVSQATATADGAFGWEQKGPQHCQAPAGLEASLTTKIKNGPDLLARVKNPRKLDSAPTAGSVVLAASGIAAPGSLDCKDPFSDANVTTQVPPDLDTYKSYQLPNGFYSTIVKVAISADGSVDDAWIYTPSGVAAFDAATLAAGKASKYSGGTSFCVPSPGIYILRADFSSR